MDWMQACRDLAYPLDDTTADAVRAALAHRVETWELLREVGTFEAWVGASAPARSRAR
jgi:hypothetical protein